MKKFLLGASLLLAVSGASLADPGPNVGCNYYSPTEVLAYFLDHGKVKLFECYY